MQMQTDVSSRGVQVMLANKLDGDGSLRFVAAALPLALALLVLCLLACLSPVSRLTAGLGFSPAGVAYGARSSPRREHWWFGVRDDWGSFLFDCLPLLRLYANVEYKVESAHRPHRRRRGSRERHRRAIVTRSLESELDLPTPSDPNLSGLSAAALALDPPPSQAFASSPRGALEMPAGVPLLAPMRPTLQMPMPMQMQMALSGEQRALAFNPLLTSQMTSSIARVPAVAGGLPVVPEAVAASAVDPEARLMATALSRSAPSDVLRRDLLLLQQHPHLYQPSTRSLGRHAHRVTLAAAVGAGSGHSGASSSRTSHTLPQFAVPPLALRPLHMRPPPLPPHPTSTLPLSFSLQSQQIPASFSALPPSFSGGTGLVGVSGASFAPITTLAVFGPESAPQQPQPQPPPSAVLSTVVALHQPPPSVRPTAGAFSSTGTTSVAATSTSSSSQATSSHLPPESVLPALSVALSDLRPAPCPLSKSTAGAPLTSCDASDSAGPERRALSAQATALSPTARVASESDSDALAADSGAPVDGSAAVPVPVQVHESGAAAASELSVSGSDGRTSSFASFASAQSSVAPFASGGPVSPPATATQAAADATARLLTCTASTAPQLQLLLSSTVNATATASSESADGETVPPASCSTTSTACALQICITSANAAHSNAPASSVSASASTTPTSGSQPHVPRTRSSRDHQFDPGQFYQPYVFATAGQTRTPTLPIASASVSAAGGARPLTSPAAAPAPPPAAAAPGAALHQQHSPGAALAIASPAPPPPPPPTQTQAQQQRGPVVHSGTAGTTGARTGAGGGGGGRLLPSIGRHLRRLGGATRATLSEKEKCRLHELEELNVLAPHSTDPARRICSIHTPD